MRVRPAFLLMLSLLAVSTSSRAAGQISPGPLARPHAGLEGTTQCLKCHPVGNKAAMDGACLECHKEITWLRNANRGLHAREARVRCASCHPDHAGADFSLVSWTRDSLARFDHRRAGWVLEGAHADAKCDDCHKQAFRVGEAAKLAPAGSPTKWWVGLETSCVSCHENVHRGNLKGPCTSCHDLKAWVPATKFNHADTRYPLTGKHQDVACEKCHAARVGMVAAGKSRMDPAFTPPRSAECSACHRDQHQGRLGLKCSECHVTTGFLDRKAGGFDHSRTRYPLEGRHAAVPCAACHNSAGRRVNPQFATCGSCHKDAHAKSSTVAAKVSDCAACHTVAGFKPSSFTTAQHSQGKCRDCHLEAHGDQLAKQPSGGSCETCHTVAPGWTTSAYATAGHKEFHLPLEGRHLTVRCGACHGEKREGLPPFTVTAALGSARVLFRLGSAECVSCHVDPHEKRYADCSECHTASGFRPTTMDLAAHAKRGFALEGAHRAQPCVACHEGMARQVAGPALLAGTTRPATLTFTSGKTRCADCHEDRHAGQFAGRVPNGCDACHGQDGFVPAARFDHNRDAAFRLDGRHAAVACVRCHPVATDSTGRNWLKYRGVSAKCESCHPASQSPARKPGAR